jgi:thiamine kinase-like enzyme
MVRKILDNASTSSQINRELVKSSSPIKYFLNESFVRDFIELHGVLPKLNLSDFEILRSCEILPIRIRKTKAIFEFQLHLYDKGRSQQQSSTSKSIVAKWIHSGQGKQIFDLLQQLWHTKGFGTVIDNKNSENHLKICEPIAYFPDQNLMLTSKVSGVRLKEILAKDKGYDDDGLFQTYVKRSAQWLAKLHSSSVTTSIISPQLTHVNIRSMQLEEKKLNEWCRHLSRLYPDFAARIHNILSCVVGIEKSVKSKCNTLIHGGFHPGNIFVDETDLTVIDFDRSCIFDPAIDLSYFISKLQTIKRKYNLSLLDTEALQKCFLDEYYCYYNNNNNNNSRTSGMSKELLLSDRLEIFLARSYLEHLHSRYCQHLHSRYGTRYERHKPDVIDFQYWVNKAEECLQTHLENS